MNVERYITLLHFAQCLYMRYIIEIAIAHYVDAHQIADDTRSAHMSTALATYKQFCARHDIETGLR